MTEAARRTWSRSTPRGSWAQTGRCPGKIILDDGTEALAYRFITLSDDEAERLIAELSAEIDNLQKAAEE